MTKKIIFLLTLFSLLLLSNAFAIQKQGHLKLLAVRENSDGSYIGGVADLYLEIREGSGRVFLETFPLTKTDTQMSTRFAKTIACDFAEKDCNDLDFFYTITADSPIIAGPSAGSSIAALTTAMLLGKEVDENVAATGTINSGGLVGPVGGLKAKIEAASKSGIKKVLIPQGESIGKEENETINTTELSKELGIKIVEVSAIEDVVVEFTGFKKGKPVMDININKEYSSKMKSLAVQLCGRSEELRHDIEKLDMLSNITGFNNSITGFNTSEISNEAKNLTSKGSKSFESQEYYSSASYCFGSNVQLRTLLLASMNLSKDELMEKSFELKEEIRKFGFKTDSIEKKTITDLETYMVVKERLEEADEVAQTSINLLNASNSTLAAVRNLAYASERYNSALSWSAFFGTAGKQFNLDKNVLKKSCQSKLSEVEERIQYVELYFPGSLENVKKDISLAYSDLSNGGYEICLFKASKAKADVDIVLSVFGVEDKQFKVLLERKLLIVRDNLAAQTLKGIFPIIGYSYYEYANSLKESNTMSGLIYSEYALELGNLDIYFKNHDPKNIIQSVRNKADTRTFKGLLAGIAVGFLIGLLVKSGIKQKKLEIKIKDK